MRLEWLEDILAVAETGSFQAAAERRCLTQPAFSRRLRVIEQSLGATLFDRSARPARLAAHAMGQLERMRELALGLRELGAALRANDLTQRKRLVIASQHAIAASATPELVERLNELDIDIRLRSANRDECLAQMMTRQADIALVYDVEGEAPLAGADFLDIAAIGTEVLIPVYAARAVEALNAAFAHGEMPIIAYPREVFLGAVQRRLILPALARIGHVRPRLETALTLAALQFARTGLGVAWTPRSLALDDIRRGTLVDLSRTLPAVPMRLMAVRVRGAGPAAAGAAWVRILGAPAPQAEAAE